MANFLGRAIRFYPNSGSAGYGSPISAGGSPVTNVPITGLRSKSISIGGEAIDITTENTSGWAEHLVVAPRKGYTLEVSGLTGDSYIIDKVKSDGVAQLTDYTLDFGPDVGVTVTGNWILSGVSLSAEYEDAVGFTATINSTGVPTIT